MKAALVAAVCLAGVLPSCVAPTGSVPVNEASVRPLLPGTWTSSRHLEGVDVYMEKTFRADGTAEGFIDIRSGTRGAAILLPRVPFRSRWKFDGNGYLITYDVRAGVPGFFEKDFLTRDRIIRAGADRIDFVDVDSGERFRFDRKARNAPGPTSWSL